MNKQDALKIAPLVNNKPALDALEYFLHLRVEELKESLVHQSPFTDLTRGGITELRRLKHLREEVNKVLETKDTTF